MQTGRDDYYMEKLRNYGSLFIGEASTVAYGDKGVGTNHTLPTGRAARYTGGLSVHKFTKIVTYERLHPARLPRDRAGDRTGLPRGGHDRPRHHRRGARQTLRGGELRPVGVIRAVTGPAAASGLEQAVAAGQGLV